MDPSPPASPPARPRKTGKREAHRAARREEILEAAFALLEEGGLDAITTPELARRTRSALGALYRFFPAKQSVIFAMQTRALAELHDVLAGSVREARARAASQAEPLRSLVPLIALADAYFAEPRRAPARFRLVDELLSRPAVVFSDEEAGALEAQLSPILQLATDQLRALADALPAPLDPDDIARFPHVLWAALHGTTHFAKRDRLVDPRFQSAALAGSLVEGLLLGLGASRQAVAQSFALAGPVALVLPGTAGVCPAGEAASLPSGRR